MQACNFTKYEFFHRCFSRGMLNYEQIRMIYRRLKKHLRYWAYHDGCFQSVCLRQSCTSLIDSFIRSGFGTLPATSMMKPQCNGKKTGSIWKSLTFDAKSSTLGKAWFPDLASLYKCIEIILIINVIQEFIKTALNDCLIKIVFNIITYNNL